MTIKNIKKTCTEIRNTCTASDPRLSSVYVEVILNTATVELRTMQHSDAYSLGGRVDNEIHVNSYGCAVTMKEIREDSERAAREYAAFKEFYC